VITAFLDALPPIVAQIRKTVAAGTTGETSAEVSA
jgi:hypothetical protein